MNSRLLSLVLFAAICVSCSEAFSLGIVSTSTSNPAKSAMQALPDTDFSHNDEYKLPIQLYKETAIALQAVLQEATSVVSQLDALSNHLKSVESMDPDLAPDILLSSTGTPRTNISSSMMLDIAVQRALDTSEITGRLSVETELAWLKVDKLLQQDDAGGAKGVKTLLSHPSFRYNYAVAHLNLRERKNDSVTEKLQSYAQRVLQGLQKMQEEVTVEQQRLEQREYSRYIFLNSLMDS
jgi:hypothetical protein